MATRNRLTDSGQKVTKKIMAQRSAKEKERVADALSTRQQKSASTFEKNPKQFNTLATHGRDMAAANRKAGTAAWRNSPKYKPIKTDELRTTNDNWGNAPLGDQYAVKYEQIEKKPYNAYTKNNYLTTRNTKLANEKATKALEKSGGKSRVKTQKRLNTPIKNRATGRKVTK